MIYKAEVIQIKNQKEYTVRFIEGQVKNKTVVIKNLPPTAYKQVPITQGENVLVSYTRDVRGKETAYITDFDRIDALFILAALFLIVVVWVGRFRGFFSVLGMVVSFIILSKGLLPSILSGNDPVLIMLLGSLIIAPLTFYLSHGMSKKTNIALVATFLSLAITGFLAYFFVLFTKLTGYSAEESVYLQSQNVNIDVRSILLAGIILGALGVLDDITVSQTSIVETLKQTNKSLTRSALYKSAMKVGRDHIASLVNTLVLVYAGASLPLFLLFYGTNLKYSLVVNQEIIATEIVRTLVSSIGIILAVPITTLIAAYVYTKK